LDPVAGFAIGGVGHSDTIIRGSFFF